MMRRWWAVWLMVVVAGCARCHNPPQPSSAPPAAAGGQNSEQTTAALQGLTNECTASMMTPRLDPIRDKVELTKPANVPTPFTILANNNYPTADEHAAIGLWGTLVDRCQQQFLAWQQAQPVPPGYAPELVSRMRGYTGTALRLGNELRALLYDGKLTYSDYAKARQAIISEGDQATRRYFAAAQAGNADAMFAIDAAYQKEAAATEAYMWKMGHGGPAQPPATGADGASPSDGRGMLEPPPIGANRPRPPAGTNGMMEPPPIAGSGR